MGVLAGPGDVCGWGTLAALCSSSRPPWLLCLSFQADGQVHVARRDGAELFGMYVLDIIIFSLLTVTGRGGLMSPLPTMAAVLCCPCDSPSACRGWKGAGEEVFNTPRPLSVTTHPLSAPRGCFKDRKRPLSVPFFEYLEC